MSEILTPDEAAEILRVSKNWLATRRKKGDGPAFTRVGNLIRYTRADLETFFNQNKGS